MQRPQRAPGLGGGSSPTLVLPARRWLLRGRTSLFRLLESLGLGQDRAVGKDHARSLAHASPPVASIIRSAWCSLPLGTTRSKSPSPKTTVTREPFSTPTDLAQVFGTWITSEARPVTPTLRVSRAITNRHKVERRLLTFEIVSVTYMNRAGRPPGFQVPTAAHEVSEVMQSDPGRTWRFLEIARAVGDTSRRGHRYDRRIDPLVARGLTWLIDHGAVTRAPEGRGYRWSSAAWAKLSELQDVLWSIQDAFQHMGEIDRYRGRQDSAGFQLIAYLDWLRELVPELDADIRRETLARLARSNIDLRRSYPSFWGKTGIIQRPLVSPGPGERRKPVR